MKNFEMFEYFLNRFIILAKQPKFLMNGIYLIENFSSLILILITPFSFSVQIVLNRQRHINL
jgi:hypothetical protein